MSATVTWASCPCLRRGASGSPNSEASSTGGTPVSRLSTVLRTRCRRSRGTFRRVLAVGFTVGVRADAELRDQPLVAELLGRGDGGLLHLHGVLIAAVLGQRGRERVERQRHATADCV